LEVGIRSNPFNKETHPNVYSGHEYALDVVFGVIPSCKYVKGAVERYLSDLNRSKNVAYNYFFDIDRAERYLRLVQKFEHVIGTWNTPNIEYSPWQCHLWMNVIGWRWKSEDRPRFRVCHAEQPRGQGKSSMASQAALYFLALDNPKGNAVECFATKKDQARIVLEASRAMAKKSTGYRNATGVKVLAHKIIHAASNSYMRALSSDEDSMDGLNSVLSIMDELHAMSRELYDVVYSGMSKRIDSLMLCITTAGFNNDGVGYSQSAYAKKVCMGEVVDDQMYAIVYTIDEGDDLFSEATWKKANPGYGISVDPVTFTAKAMKARTSPADLPNFKVKHLNIWLSEARAFFDIGKMNQCANPNLQLTDFYGESCYVGIDLASKLDLTGYVLIFKKEKKYFWFTRAFIPQVTFDNERSDMYIQAADRGENIYMGEGSQMMIHKPLTMTWGNRDEHDKSIAILDGIQSQMVGIYARKTGKPREEINQMLSDDYWMTADKAVELGFATELMGEADGINAAASMIQSAKWINLRNAPEMKDTQANKKRMEELKNKIEGSIARISNAALPKA